MAALGWGSWWGGRGSRLQVPCCWECWVSWLLAEKGDEGACNWEGRPGAGLRQVLAGSLLLQPFDQAPEARASQLGGSPGPALIPARQGGDALRLV